MVFACVPSSTAKPPVDAKAPAATRGFAGNPGGTGPYDPGKIGDPRTPGPIDPNPAGPIDPTTPDLPFKSQFGFAAPKIVPSGRTVLAEHKTLVSAKKGPLTGYPIAEDLGLNAPGLDDLGATIDRAREEADVVGLAALSARVRSLEMISGRKSKYVTADQLEDEAGLLLWEHKPDRRPGIETYAVLGGYLQSGRKTEATRLAQAIAKQGYGFGYASQDDASEGGGGSGDGQTSSTAEVLYGVVRQAVKEATTSNDPPPPTRNSADVRGFALSDLISYPGTGALGAFVHVENHSGHAVRVYIDGVAFGSVGPNWYDSFAVHPGTTHVEVVDPIGGETTGSAYLAPGQTYSLNVDATPSGARGFAGSKSSLKRPEPPSTSY